MQKTVNYRVDYRRKQAISGGIPWQVLVFWLWAAAVGLLIVTGLKSVLDQLLVLIK